MKSLQSCQQTSEITETPLLQDRKHRHLMSSQRASGSAARPLSRLLEKHLQVRSHTNTHSNLATASPVHWVMHLMAYMYSICAQPLKIVCVLHVYFTETSCECLWSLDQCCPNIWWDESISRELNVRNTLDLQNWEGRRNWKYQCHRKNGWSRKNLKLFS